MTSRARRSVVGGHVHRRCPAVYSDRYCTLDVGVGHREERPSRSVHRVDLRRVGGEVGVLVVSEDVGDQGGDVEDVDHPVANRLPAAGGRTGRRG